jgi:hypothetical protein
MSSTGAKYCEAANFGKEWVAAEGHSARLSNESDRFHEQMSTLHFLAKQS